MKERKGAILALISSVFRLTDEIDVRLSMLIFVVSSSDLKQNSKIGENLHKVTVQIMFSLRSTYQYLCHISLNNLLRRRI